MFKLSCLCVRWGAQTHGRGVKGDSGGGAYVRGVVVVLGGGIGGGGGARR